MEDWILFGIIMVMLTLLYLLVTGCFLSSNNEYRTSKAMWNMSHFFFWLILAWAGIPWYYALAISIGWEAVELGFEWMFSSSTSKVQTSFWHEEWAQKGLNLIANTSGFLVGVGFAAIQ